MGRIYVGHGGIMGRTYVDHSGNVGRTYVGTVALWVEHM